MLFDVVRIAHIITGSIAILAGMSTLIPRKGSALHIRMGMIFFYSMIIMTLSAAIMALFHEGSFINATIAGFTFYLVITARRSAANNSGNNGSVEKLGFVLIACLTLAFVILSIEVSKAAEGHLGDGIPPETYYVFTVFASLALLLDIRVLAKGGVFGAQRIARHLWRMCFALFIATASLFLGQPQVFPESIRDPLILGIPVIAVILSLLFWIVKVYVSPRFRGSTMKKEMA